MGLEAQTVDASDVTSTSVVARPTFCSEHRNGVDAKNRVVLPAPYRPHFADGGFLTPWQGECLAAMPRVEWERYVADVAAFLATSNEARPDEVLREVHRSAVEFRLDIQGRMPLDAEVRARAGIGDEVCFVGAGPRVELWAAESLAARDADREDSQSTLTLLQRTLDVTRLGS